MNTKGFFKKEDCMNNSVYMDEPVDQWFFSENDMMLFAKRYYDMRLSERQQPSEAKNNPDTKQLIIGDVSGSYSVNDMDDAYDKGFKDAMLKYRE